MLTEKSLGKKLLKIFFAGAALAGAASAIWVSANRLSLKSFHAYANAKAIYTKKRHWDIPDSLFSNRASLLAAIATGIIGAASTLLITPTSGKELRRKLKSKLTTLRHHQPSHFFLNSTLPDGKEKKHKVKRKTKEKKHHLTSKSSRP